LSVGFNQKKYIRIPVRIHVIGGNGSENKEEARRMGMIKRINNITFAVSNLKETISFYENVLGLKKTAEWTNYVTFDVGGTDLAFEPGGKKGRREGAPDVFVLVDDVDDAYKKLREKGVKFATEPKDQYWGGRTAAFLDPDENVFILVHFKT
jgi:catechol 2,3-dioxygenase-like lactoylglutathione lyase family enzyme